MSDTPNNSGESAQDSVFAVHSIGIGGVDVHQLSGSGSVLAIVGANNVGKSTLIEQLWQRMNSNSEPGDSSPLVLSDLDCSWRATREDIEAWLRSHSHVTQHDAFTTFARNGVQERSEVALNRVMAGNGFQNLVSWFVQRLGPFDRSNFVLPTARPSTVGDPPTHPQQASFIDGQVRKAVISIARKLFGIDLYFDAVSNQLSWRIGDPGIDAPAANEMNVEYARAVGAMRGLDQQGDGIRSALGAWVGKPLVG